MADLLTVSPSQYHSTPPISESYSGGLVISSRILLAIFCSALPLHSASSLLLSVHPTVDFAAGYTYNVAILKLSFTDILLLELGKVPVLTFLQPHPTPHSATRPTCLFWTMLWVPEMAEYPAQSNFRLQSLALCPEA